MKAAIILGNVSQTPYKSIDLKASIWKPDFPEFPHNTCIEQTYRKNQNGEDYKIFIFNNYSTKWRRIPVSKCAKQTNNIALKGDFSSFVLVTITIFSGANPARVARKWIAKDIRSLSSQSKHRRRLSFLKWVCLSQVFNLENI